MDSNLLSLTATVLRDPHALVERADEPEVMGRLVPRLLLLTGVGGGLFGLVAGSYRGELQLLYAAIKMPIFLVVPLFVCLPAVRAIYQAAGGTAPYRRLALAACVGTARTSILAAATGPALWLLYSLQPDYHFAVLCLAAALIVVGLPGLSVVASSARAPSWRGWIAALASFVLLGAVSAQSGWLLRPFIARPRAEVAFLRPVEADVWSALGSSGIQAAGGNTDWEPTSSGLIGRGLQNTREQE